MVKPMTINHKHKLLITTMTNLALFASTARSTEHEEFPSRLCGRHRHRRGYAVAGCRPDVRRVIAVRVPSISRDGGMGQILAGHVGTQSRQPRGLVHRPLDVRQTRRR